MVLAKEYPSCVLRSEGSHAALTSTWTQVWQIVARSVSLPGTSRAACALLHTILEADLIKYHTISEDINRIVTTADVNGPAVLVDSSLTLMLHLLQLRNSRLPSASQTTCHHVIRWIFLRWNPGERLCHHCAVRSTVLTSSSRPGLCIPAFPAFYAIRSGQPTASVLWGQSSASPRSGARFRRASQPSMEVKVRVGSRHDIPPSPG